MPDKFSRQIDHRCMADARLEEDGTFRVTVRGQSSWRDGAQASAEVSVDPKLADKVQAALQAVLDAHHEAVAHAADQAAGIARNQEAERGMTFDELGARTGHAGVVLE